jgi:SET domain-containing protein
VVLFTTRDVHRGEELTYDYQFAPEIPERETPCACGAQICRGVINWRGDQNRS